MTERNDYKNNWKAPFRTLVEEQERGVPLSRANVVAEERKRKSGNGKGEEGRESNRRGELKPEGQKREGLVRPHGRSIVMYISDKGKVYIYK